MRGASRGLGISYHDAVADFISAMEAEGVKPVEPIAQRLSSGELIRFRCDGDGKGRQNGWAKLYLDERPAGAFGNYRMGLSLKWSSASDRVLPPEERDRFKAEWAAKRRERLAERARSEAEAARDAVEMLAAAGPASPDHPYAKRKRLVVDHLRQAGGNLLIPMFDGAGRIWNLQRIAGDGSKRFLKGGRTEGLFTVIGRFDRAGQTACVGEGFATMSAVHRATGFPCIPAFSAKNILPVARLWRDARPDLDLVICADDDPELIDNPNIRKNLGLEAAKAAAEEIGARLAVPTREAA